jgi:hypothetical protein
VSAELTDFGPSSPISIVFRSWVCESELQACAGPLLPTAALGRAGAANVPPELVVRTARPYSHIPVQSVLAKPKPLNAPKTQVNNVEYKVPLESYELCRSNSAARSFFCVSKC